MVDSNINYILLFLKVNIYFHLQMKILMRNQVQFSYSLLRRQNTDIHCIMILMGKAMIWKRIEGKRMVPMMISTT